MLSAYLSKRQMSPRRRALESFACAKYSDELTRPTLLLGERAPCFDFWQSQNSQWRPSHFISSEDFSDHAPVEVQQCIANFKRGRDARDLRTNAVSRVFEKKGFMTVVRNLS